MSPSTPKKSTVSFHLTNCTGQTAVFIGGIARLFCDPALAEVAAMLANGMLVLHMNPDTGTAEIAVTPPGLRGKSLDQTSAFLNNTKN